MFEVGFTEIVLILAIALLVLGPARLPKLAADVGRWAGRARAMARQLRTQLEQEARIDPLQDIRKEMNIDLTARSQTIHTPAPQAAASSAPPAATPTPSSPDVPHEPRPG